MTSIGAQESQRRDESQQGFGLPGISLLMAVVVALPWFWPFPTGPIKDFWSDWLAWSSFLVLLGVFPVWGARHTHVLATGWLIAALGNAAIALLQYFDLENGMYPWIAYSLPGYPMGHLFQPNLLATLLVVGGWALVWLIREGRTTGRTGAGLGVLLITALASTASRSGAVLFLVSMVLLAWWGRPNLKRTWQTIGGAMAVYLASALLLPYIGRELFGLVIERDLFGRFSSGIAAEGCSSRLILWSNMLELIAVRPWQGWGPGALLHAHYSFPFEGVRFCEKLSNAHNILLHSAFVFGIPLTGVFLGLASWVVVKTKPWAVGQSDAQLGVSLVVMLGIHSLLEYPMWYGGFQVTALWAAFLVYSGGESQLLTDFFGAKAHRLRWVVVAAMPLLGFVAWQYIKVSQPYLPPSDRMEGYRDQPVEKAQDLILFRDHLLIGQIVQTELNPRTAPLIHKAALEALKVAPDPQVIIRVIESAALLGLGPELQRHIALFERAWPTEYATWLEQQRKAQTRAASGTTS